MIFSGLWREGDHNIMSITIPTDGSAILRKVAIQNIDNERNMMCPCNHGACVGLCPRLLPVCALQFEDVEAAHNGDDTFADDIRIHIIIIICVLRCYTQCASVCNYGGNKSCYA